MGMFSWDKMAEGLQEDVFGEKKAFSSKADTRFWRLSLDENRSGGALIRFIPDADLIPFISMVKINASRGGKQFFVNEYSPSSIGLKDPFEEKFTELWRKGTDDKDDKGNWVCPYKKIAKTLGRNQRYITNIKVIKDPSNPANEGKVFLYDVSSSMMDVLKAAMQPTESEIALGAEPKNIFDPVEGHNFLIKASLGANKLVTYTSSKFDEKITGIYSSEEEAMKDISANTHKLGDFLKPDFFLSYDELKARLDKFLSADKSYQELFKHEINDTASEKVEKTEKVQKVEKVEKAEKVGKPKDSDSELDDLLADLD